jgi:uncharacterized protein involved in outer membrane biogenesis
VAGAGLAVVLVIALTWALRATPQIRERVVAALNERFDSKVELQTLEVAVVPKPRVAGTGLTLRHEGRTDVPPLISIASFEASARALGLLRTPLHLRNVTLQDLEIQMPVGGLTMGDSNEDEAHQPHDVRPSPLLIDEIVSRSARLEIASRKAGRLPRVFEIHDLVMRDFGLPGGAPFSAGVSNPVPRGRVETTGTFGPWHADEPGLTPIRGSYTFANADMDVIKGLGGILSSVGTYRGLLQRIEVEGQTEIPDFSIDIAGQPVPLSTRFTAVVDGTNGDTFLEHVEAKLADSIIIAKGAVVRTKEVKGRHTTLDITIDNARLEDLMRLAVKASTPPLTGRVEVRTRLLLPAGPADVIERLQLDGVFSLAQARFANIDVQKKIAMLSLRGRGDESSIPDGQSVVSNLTGRFSLKEARLTFSDLSFAVPGAVVQLSGVYDLRGETVAFTGYLLTDATLADMTSGIKSVIARLAQPLFRRPGGGSKLPIRIVGPRSKPAFGLDTSRIFGRG